MNRKEQVVQFDCESEHLVGIVSLPDVCAEPAMRTGVVIIVGGPQYRAGSHRQFVLLARALADAGVPVLRFDYRGMGDSTGALHTFESVNEDIACAITALQAAAPDLKHVALWGLCDGASAALLYCGAMRDARVKGLCLLNPWVRSDASLAKTQVKHYYTQRLRQKAFWVKLLSGKVAVHAVRGLARNINQAFSRASPPTASSGSKPFQVRMAQAWSEFRHPILLILSGNDYTAKEFLEYTGSSSAWTGALGSRHLKRHSVADADHTFSSAITRALVENCTVDWVKSLWGKANEG